MTHQPPHESWQADAPDWMLQMGLASAKGSVKPGGHVSNGGDGDGGGGIIDDGSGSGRVLIVSGWVAITAEGVAETTLKALDKGRLYVLPQVDARLIWRAKRYLPATYARGAGLLSRFTLAKP